VKFDLTINTKELQDLQNSVKRLSEEKAKQVEITLGYVMESAEKDAVELVTSNKSVNVGTLRQGIRAERLPVKGGSKHTGILRSNANYSSAIEFGRSPGTFPKLGDGSKADGGLRYWVKRKLQVPNDEVAGVAFAIGRKIQRFGTQPKPFMRPTYEKWSKRFGDELRKMLK
jgi:hypothetical protein